VTWSTVPTFLLPMKGVQNNEGLSCWVLRDHSFYAGMTAQMMKR
jgi:hypothetical protein